MPGGLYQNRIYLGVLTGIGIDNGENLTSLSLAVGYVFKKIRKTKSTMFCGTFRNYLLSQMPSCGHFETICPLSL